MLLVIASMEGLKKNVSKPFGFKSMISTAGRAGALSNK